MTTNYQSIHHYGNQPMHPYSDFTIGALLIDSGKLTKENAEKIILSLKTDEANNEGQGVRFGDKAKSLGFVDDKDISEVIAKQFNFSYVDKSTKFSEKLYAAFNQHSIESEFLKGLRTQLILNWFKEDKKLLSVSSVDAKSGNSVFVANLAVSFSQMGKKTLLIDANLRDPSIHSFFNINPSKKGLSDMLVGRAGPESIYAVEPLNNLSVITAGTKPPNPLEIIGSEDFKHLLEFLHKIYDVILIDTPAFSTGSEAQIISVLTGGVMLVMKKDVTYVDKMNIVNRSIHYNGSQVVGTMLTDF